ncbi:MAG: ammonium transporter [Thaumarchaeota archaeon]|nr:ammonium transporter [Nitrososphaerota archaeon]MCL5318078.1 ammonium transporter [Nitrososphaerota archaeon]
MAVDSADTAFVLISAALVLLMTPALAFFYGGLVRRKNVLSTIMYSFITIAVITLQWVIFGYSLSFGPNIGGFIGNLDWLGLKGVGGAPSAYAPTIPAQAFMIFQMMFAIITPALITGAFIDRMKFSTFLVFTLAWTTVVYDPVAHWVWADGGWLRSLGALDFAGGTVVHISSGISALAAALVIGKRKGLGNDPMEPHDIRLMVLGVGLLWFGWFGFNSGSALSSGTLATSAFVVTHVAAAAAALSWMVMSWLRVGKPSVTGAATGGVAGLVAITPASGFVDPMGAIAIGLGVGVISFLAIELKSRLGFDDALDVWACHGIGGTWGALATGLFAQLAINPAGADGLLYGNPALLGSQAIAVGVTWVYSFTVTFILLKVLDRVMGLRVTGDEEEIGLDLTQHGERVPV